MVLGYSFWTYGSKVPEYLDVFIGESRSLGVVHFVLILVNSKYENSRMVGNH